MVKKIVMVSQQKILKKFWYFIKKIKKLATTMVFNKKTVVVSQQKFEKNFGTLKKKKN